MPSKENVFLSKRVFAHWANSAAFGLSAIFYMLPSPKAQAAELAGVTFEESLSHENNNLVLNGVGLRKFAIFKVYAGALYLTQKSTDDRFVLESSTPKLIRMHFLRDVGSKDIQKAWQDGFQKNCSGDDCTKFANEVKELNSLMKELKEKDRLQFAFTQQNLKVWHNETLLGTVQKEGFSKNILAIFLGRNPPNEGLKSGLLGKK
jgi:hypothetical protein